MRTPSPGPLLASAGALSAPLARDTEFQSRYRSTRHGRGFGVAIAVAVAAIALLVLGTSYLDWTW